MGKDSICYQMNRQGGTAGQAILKEFREICKDPGRVSEELLMKILRDNEDTEYGRKYNFRDIGSVKEYRENVPVITYDDIDGSIERMKAGEKNILTAYKFTHMNETSGTVGKQKAVPLTEEQTKVFMKYSNQITLGVLTEAFGESWMEGRSFSPSEGNARTLDSGITVGCASSIMAKACRGGLEPYSSMLKGMYTSPPEAMLPGPGINTRYMHTRFAMADREVTGITGGFMSNILHLMMYIHDNYELLINDIESGTINPEIEMPDDIRESLLKRIEPMPERAAELREIFRNGPDIPFMPLVWPKMLYISAVGGDGFKVYDDTMKAHYHGGKIHTVYAGVTASEGLWSVPIAVDDMDSVLVPDSAFMEFLPVEAGDDFSQVRSIDELEEGKIYELIITNLCGFYRYRMSDAVKVTGFEGRTPKIQFMYRVNKTINLACEKTTEAALMHTAQKVSERLGFELMDYEVYPDQNSVPGKYIFMIETPNEKRFDISREELCKAVLEELREANPEFGECYDESLIQAPDAWFEEPETQMLYRDLMIFKGASSSQFKAVHVISNEQQANFFLGMREK